MWLIMGKKIKLIMAGVLFCILFMGCGKIFEYILIDDTASYTRITFHEMYEQDNIDTLFVGSSHCYRSFIPEILDEKLGVNTFNGGTSSQYLDGSYMIIKEAAKYNNVQHIYLELYYNVGFEVYKERTNMTQTYIISDYLKPSLDRVQYLLNASTKDYYINSFILARRNWHKFFEADYIKDLMIKKGSNDYKDYQYTYVTHDTEWYAGKGYVANSEIIENWDYFSDRAWSNMDLNKISEDWRHSLEDIIAFCDKKDISLTLISAPMSNYLLSGIGNYDEYIAFVQDIIADTDVNYYDFNLCKEEYFENTSSLFKDTDHMNCYGAEKFSLLFADFVNGEIPENELFYDSYKEKLEHLTPAVFGVSYHDEDKGKEEQTRECRIVSTGNDNLEYEIVISPEEGQEYKIQSFSDNEFFTVPAKEKGVITIRYRLSNLPEEIQTVSVSY